MVFNIMKKTFACLFVIFVNSAYAALPCQLSEVSSGHLVCVCNATFCDTLDADTDVPNGEYVLFSTTKAGQRFAKSTGSLSDATCTADLQISVDVKSTINQKIFGFGTGFTDSAGINLMSLSSPAQEKLLQSYFSPEGIELGIGRVPIAGSDFSTHPYTYDEVEGDDDLSEFDLTSEDFTYKIPIIKRAMNMSRKEIKLVAAAWSSPTWMKTNNEISGVGQLKVQYYQQWADYQLKFLNAYANHSIGFWGISTGNEPINGLLGLVKFNSLGWTPQTQAKWLAENFGPTIKNSDHNQTKILALDDQRFLLPGWIIKMALNEEAASYIDGIAVHWYTDQWFSPSILTNTHEEFPDKFIIYTESCAGYLPWENDVVLGAWDRAEEYVSDIIENLNNWVSGWIDWNFALDQQGGPNWVENFVDSTIIVKNDTDEFYKQPTFYALGHFSKFIPEGSVHITTTPDSADGVYTTTVITPDGQTVMVLYNKEGKEKQVRIQHSEKGFACITIPSYSINTLLL